MEIGNKTTFDDQALGVKFVGLGNGCGCGFKMHKRRQQTKLHSTLEWRQGSVFRSQKTKKSVQIKSQNMKEKKRKKKKKKKKKKNTTQPNVPFAPESLSCSLFAATALKYCTKSACNAIAVGACSDDKTIRRIKYLVSKSNQQMRYIRSSSSEYETHNTRQRQKTSRPRTKPTRNRTRKQRSVERR